MTLRLVLTSDWMFPGRGNARAPIRWSREFYEPIALPDGRKLCMTRPAPTRERELTEAGTEEAM